MTDVGESRDAAENIVSVTSSNTTGVAVGSSSGEACCFRDALTSTC